MADLAAAVELWQLERVVEIADTPSSILYRAMTPDQASVVVKLLKPAGLGELPGMDYLAWRKGHGAIRLLARHETIGLLEDAGTITLRDYHASHGEDATNAVFVALLAELHAPSPLPAPHKLVPLERHFQALFEPTNHPATPRDAANVVWAGELARQLLAHQQDVIPLHGDLHHDNVLSSDVLTWKAIDAHGLIGERAYDVANIFGNPLGSPRLVLDPDRIERLAFVLARALGVSATRVLSFAAVHAALSACWSLGEPAGEAHSDGAGERLALLDLLRARLS